jgi:hypothetical protein
MLFLSDPIELRRHLPDKWHVLYFLHLPKTSGSALSGRRLEKLGHAFSIPHVYRIPATLGGFDGFKTDTFQQYHFPNPNSLRFTIIRNPYDLLCSYYFHGMELRKDGRFSHSGWAAVNYTHNFKTFREFVYGYCNSEIKWHIPLLKQFLFSQLFDAEGRCNVDFIIKYEYFDDAARELQKIGIPLGRIRFNVSHRKKEKYYAYYDEELIPLVAKKCARELEAFGYNFNNSLNSAPFIVPKNLRYDIGADRLYYVDISGSATASTDAAPPTLSAAEVEASIAIARAEEQRLEEPSISHEATSGEQTQRQSSPATQPSDQDEQS